MKRGVAYPYLSAPDDSVTGTEWQYSVDGTTWSPVEDYIAHWASNRAITFRRTLQLSPETILRSVQLNCETARLAALVLISTGDVSGARSVAWSSGALTGTTQEVHATFAVPGSQVCQSIGLSTRLVSSGTPSNSANLAPRYPASCLWQDDVHTRVEQQDSRFPMDLRSFSRDFPGRGFDGARWYLECADRSPEADIRGFVILHVNNDVPGLAEALNAGDGALLSELRCYLVRQLTTIALQSAEEVESLAGMPDGSVGRTVYNWIKQLPVRSSTPLRDVKQILESDPAAFEAMVSSTYSVIQT